MSRSSALNYYAQTFAVPTTTFAAESASNVLLWMSLTILCLPLVFAVMSGCFKNTGGRGDICINVIGIFALVARIAWIVTLSIIFHRIQISWKISQDNMQILTGQSSFSATVSTCGDPLTAMNIDRANSYMLAASVDVGKSYWFCLSMILLICLEIVLGMVVLLGSCCGSSTDQSDGIV
jgi:hypothetical protein